MVLLLNLYVCGVSVSILLVLFVKSGYLLMLFYHLNSFASSCIVLEELNICMGIITCFGASFVHFFLPCFIILLGQIDYCLFVSSEHFYDVF